MAGKPPVDNFGIAGEVTGDAVAGALEAAGVIAVFIDDTIRRGSGGMDETDAAGFRDKEEGDVVIESDDADSGTVVGDLSDEFIVIESSADGHLFSGHEGADDTLGRLLGEAESFDSKAGIAEDGGDKISAGDFAGAGGFAGAIEVPWRAEPAPHHFGKGVFEGRLAFGYDIGDFPGGAGLGVAVGEIEALLIECGDQFLVAIGIRAGSFLRRGSGVEVLLVEREEGRAVSPTGVGATDEDEDYENSPEFFHRCPLLTDSE